MSETQVITDLPKQKFLAKFATKRKTAIALIATGVIAEIALIAYLAKNDMLWVSTDEIADNI